MPIVEINMLDRQRAYDTVKAHLIAQGRPSVGNDFMCRYRHPDGLKCAVGALIPDEKYHPDLEGLTPHHGLVIDAIPGATHADAGFLRALQKAHDAGAAPGMTDENARTWLTNAMSALERVALTYWLKP